MQNQLGPKLLVSSLTTHDRPVLKWRLRVTGNAAVEFGVVPSSLAVNMAYQQLWLLHFMQAALSLSMLSKCTSTLPVLPSPHIAVLFVLQACQLCPYLAKDADPAFACLCCRKYT